MCERRDVVEEIKKRNVQRLCFLIKIFNFLDEVLFDIDNKKKP